jgi:hypothetical protein
MTQAIIRDVGAGFAVRLTGKKLLLSVVRI